MIVSRLFLQHYYSVTLCENSFYLYCVNPDTHLKKTFKLCNLKINHVYEKKASKLCNLKANYEYKKKVLDYVIQNIIEGYF